MKKKTPDLITTNKMIETIYEALEHYVPGPLFRKRTFYPRIKDPGRLALDFCVSVLSVLSR